MRQHTGGVRNQTPTKTSKKYRDYVQSVNKIVREMERRHGVHISRAGYHRKVAERYIRMHNKEI